MGQKKKQGKDRLDKYYHLAKSQGYRARSAFKLIQLNKKYNFLEKARVCIDLCAAPGGWLQVASKYMPVSSIIVGVDLAPIKPIPRVITHIEDITTDKCRSTLKKDLKDWKADVVLHDGAPNVGTAWLQDAFSQSELTLSALKLAVEFLGKGGTFVTKVFRSKDYNSLLWVFHQLFRRVEATKPPSSRNVSAEIFVVCRDFLAPKKIDPKYLDPKYVFKDLDVTPEAGLTAKASLKDLINPEKAAKKRHRDGYNDNDYTLHHTTSVVNFVAASKESDAIIMLAKFNALTWDTADVQDLAEQVQKEDSAENNADGDAKATGNADKADDMDVDWTSVWNDPETVLQVIRKHPSTSDEIVHCLSDLKVLGRKDYKDLLKWRQKLRAHLLPNSSKEKTGEKTEPTASQGQVETVQIVQEDGETLADELDTLANAVTVAEKRAKRKRLERLAKDRRRMQLHMVTPADIGLEAAENEMLADDLAVDHNQDDPDARAKTSLLDLRKIKVAASAQSNGDIPLDAEMDEEEQLKAVQDSDDELTELESLDGEDMHDGSDSDVAEPSYAKDMEEMYEDYIQRKISKNPKEKVKQLRAQEKEFKGFSDDDEDASDFSDDGAHTKVSNSDSSDDASSDESDFASEEEEHEAPQQKTNKNRDEDQATAKAVDLWFSRPVFQDLDMEDDEDDEDQDEMSSDGEHMDEDAMDFSKETTSISAVTPNLLTRDKSAKKASKVFVDSEEEVDHDSDAEQDDAAKNAEDVLSTAEALTLAINMVQDGRRNARDVLDTYGYNRNTFAEDASSLPKWFVDDEVKHRRPNLPITKEAVDRMRQRQKELDARPMKKVMEAKARKKYKAVKKLERLRKKMNTMFEEGNDVGDNSQYDPEMGAKLGQISKLMRNAVNKAKAASHKKVQVVVAKGGNRGNKGRPKGVKGRYKMVDGRMKKEVRAERKQKQQKKGKRK